MSVGVGEWQPYISQSLAGYGPVGKVITLAFGSEGIAPQYKWYPWKRSYKLAEEAVIDSTAPWRKNKKRLELFYFSKPVVISKQALFFRKSSPIQWDKFTDLKGLKIGGTIGYSYGDNFDALIKNKLFTFETARSDTINLKKLLKGRIHAFPCDILVCTSLISDIFSSEDADKLTYSGSQQFEHYPLYLIVSKKHKDAKKIIEIFNRGLEGLKIPKYE